MARLARCRACSLILYPNPHSLAPKWPLPCSRLGYCIILLFVVLFCGPLCDAQRSHRWLTAGVDGPSSEDSVGARSHGLTAARKLLQDSGNTAAGYDNSRLENCKPRGNTYKGERLVWTPQSDKYLVATCLSGQATNRVFCFMRQLLTAVVLNRTLIIPEEDLRQEIGGPYDYSIVMDIEHMRGCLGPNTVITLKEFFAEHPEEKPKLKVDRLACWQPDCNFHGSVHSDDDKWPVEFDEKKLRTLELPPREVRPATPQHMKVQETADAFGRFTDRVLCLGDILGTGWTDGGPTFESLGANLPQKCQLLFKPSKAVVQTSRSFVREFLGENYAALHLRRNDFQEFYYLSLHERGFFPLREVAECVSAKLLQLRMRILFLITDASEAEVRLFESFLAASAPPGRGAVVVRLPPMTNQWWAHELTAPGLGNSSLAIASVEKFIGGLATTFVSTKHSSFSMVINEVRRWLAVPDCGDGVVCEGRPWQDPVPSIVSRLINDSAVVPPDGRQ